MNLRSKRKLMTRKYSECNTKLFCLVANELVNSRIEDCDFRIPAHSECYGYLFDKFLTKSNVETSGRYGDYYIIANFLVTGANPSIKKFMCRLTFVEIKKVK